MIVLKAIKDNLPFYTIGDSKTKADWLTELNITESEFQILIGDFKEINTDIICEEVPSDESGKFYLNIARTAGLTENEATSIKTQVDAILVPYNV